MKRFNFAIQWLVIFLYVAIQPALAGLPPTRSGGQSGSLSTTFDFRAPLNQITKTSGTTGLIETGNYNLLANPGFEATTFSSNWTASGGSFVAAISTNIFYGKGATWDGSGSSQTLTSTAVTIPEGFKGNNCEASMYVKVPSGTSTYTIEAWDGTTTLATATVASTTFFGRNVINFPCPSSGTIALRLVTVAADEPLIALDEAYLGLARNIGITNFITDWQTYTPTITGHGTVTNNVAYWRRVGDTLEVMGRYASGTPTGVSYRISLPTGLNWDAAKTSIFPQSFNFGLLTKSVSVTTSYPSTDIGPFAIIGVDSSRNAVGASKQVNVSANHFLAALGNDITLSSLDTFSYHFRVPIVGWTAGTFVLPNVQGISWSGFHANDCVWTTSSAAFANPANDGSCTFTERTNRNFGTVTTSGASTPGIVFTPRVAGRYFVCASGGVYNSTAAAYSGLELRYTTAGITIATSGMRQVGSGTNDERITTICGIVDITAFTSATIQLRMNASAGTTTLSSAGSGVNTVEWSIFNIDQTVQALLANSVISRDAVGGQVTTINTVLSRTANYTATANDETILASTTGGAWTLSLPAASGLRGKKYHIVLPDDTANALTIDPNSTETICGRTTVLMRGLRDSMVIQSDGTNWIGLDGSCWITRTGRYAGAAGSCGTPTILGNWISSCSRTSAGNYTVTFHSSVFQDAPNCTVTSGAVAGTNGSHVSWLGAPSTSSMQVLIEDSGGAETDLFFGFVCNGPR